MLASLRIYTPQNYYITSVSLSMLLKNGKYSFSNFDQNFFCCDATRIRGMIRENKIVFGQ